jgi:hypothetical protein
VFRRHIDAGIIAAGGIDQDCRNTKPLSDGFPRVRKRSAIKRVASNKFRGSAAPTNRSDRCLSALLVPAEYCDLSSGRRQAFGNRSTEYARAADYDGNFAGQIK